MSSILIKGAIINHTKNHNMKTAKTISAFVVKDMLTTTKSKPVKEKKVKIPTKVNTVLATLPFITLANAYKSMEIQPNSVQDVLFSAHPDILKVFDAENVKGYKCSPGRLDIKLNVKNTILRIEAIDFLVTERDKATNKVLKTKPRFNYFLVTERGHKIQKLNA